MVVFGQKWFFTDKSGSIRAKVVVSRQSSCIRAKLVLVRQKWMFSGKSGSFRAKVVLFGQ